MASSSPRALREAPWEVVQRRIRLLVADGTPMGCQLFQTSLKVYRNQLEVVACAVSRADVLTSFSQNNVDIALICADLEDGRYVGLQVLRELRSSYPKTPVIVLFDSLQDDLILDAFRAGARGILSRAEPLESLGKCIQAVHNGQVWANSTQMQLLLQAFFDTAPIRPVDSKVLRLLTKREAQVVVLAIDGMTNREIAVKLAISEHTVGNYLFRVYNKLGISSRVELVLYIVKQRESGHSLSTV